jgi:hypothetical protein
LEICISVLLWSIFENTECGFVGKKCGKTRLTDMVSLDVAIECGFVDEKCGKKRLIGMVSLDVAKAFNTVVYCTN